jgi:aquaporin Z
MNANIRSYIAEFLGTFVLVFIGTSVATLQGFLNQGPAGWLGTAFAFGFTLMVLVWTVGPVSGCHVNPAVTIAMGLAGRMKRNLILGYLVAQVLGALAASAVLLILMQGMPGYDLATHGLGANGNPHSMTVWAMFGWEMVMTAIFLCVILSATREGVPLVLSGLAIGGFLFVAHLVGVPLGDSSLNPARSIGPALLQGGAAVKVLWIFIAGPIVGGIIGWQAHNLVYGD